ncbi:MAG: rod shape-determining protein MreC [Myxococcaceae bacterium]|nr:rod shape-determining protein MreC [Myxococcaceae bacterium]
MFALLKRYRELIVVSALLLVPFGLFLAHGTVPREPNFVDRTVLAITAPLERALGFCVDSVVAGWKGYVDLRGVREKNQALVRENAELLDKVRALTEAELENQRLRGLLDYAQTHEGREIAARVIGVNPAGTPLSIRLDRGSDDGVEKGAAVITHAGIVGQVIRVTGRTCDVMLLTDPNSHTAVMVQRTRSRATATGAGGGQNLILEYVRRTDDLKEGDTIVTAGTDGVFPPGLLVGKAIDVVKKSAGMFQSAEVVPAVDTTRLEDVLILPLVHWEAPAETAAVTARDGGAREAGP